MDLRSDELINQRHIDMYTLLYFSRRLLHVKKKKSNNFASISLILADKVICLCHWANFFVFPVSDHFVLHQGWSVTRELTVLFLFIKEGLKVIHEFLTKV